MQVEFLPNRTAVIEKTTALTSGVQREWIGMGRTAAWIKLPDFQPAVRDARRRGVEFKVVVFFEGDADKHFQTWSDMGAEVRFFEHGYIRLLIFDDSDAIVAFPKVVTSLLEDREYFGYHLHDERSVTELRNYFNQIWEQAQTLPLLSTEDNRVQIRERFASGVLRFIVRVVWRAFPDWFGK